MCCPTHHISGRFLDEHAKIVRASSHVVDSQSYTIVTTGEFDLEVHSIWKDYLKMIEDSMEGFRLQEKLRYHIRHRQRRLFGISLVISVEM